MGLQPILHVHAKHVKNEHKNGITNPVLQSGSANDVLQSSQSILPQCGKSKAAQAICAFSNCKLAKVFIKTSPNNA